MATTIDWFSSELGIGSSSSNSGDDYCASCGEGDRDWCGDCNGCRYSECDTCTCGDYCASCGRGDSDWCDDCNGCRYRGCDTCTCEHEFCLTVTYHVTVTARSLDDINSSDVHDACTYSYPDHWED